MNQDAELLSRYVTERSESAFAELTRRHVDLVYSAALRLLGGDGARAEDVTQQVFAELARQAHRLARHPALAGWLYTTTRWIASRSTRTEYRRRARELEANAMNEMLRESAPGPEWEHLRPVLDDAMHELGEKDRLAVLLRYFQNKSLKEVGAALGLKENAARMRVDRALEKLRAQLARKGVTSTAATLAAAMAGHAVSAAPTAFVATLATASLASAATGSAVSLLNLMTMTKLQAGIVGAIAVATVTTPLVMQHQSKLRESHELLRQKDVQLAQLAEANQRPSDATARASSAMRDEEFKELLRLRGEVGLLRKQTDELGMLRTENNRLRTSLNSSGQNAQEAEDDPAAEEEKRFAIAQMNDAKILMIGFHHFAEDNQDRFPTNSDQIARYLNDVPALTGTNEFEIVYQGSLKELASPASTIVLRGRHAVRTRDGRWAKAYGFADGHSEFHADATGNFEAWEKQRMPTTERGPSRQ